MGPILNKKEFEDPSLEYEDGSEVAAAVDVSVYGSDKIFRPIYINQDDQILALTPEDAKRLLGFLRKAVRFVDDYQERIVQ
jgi:hypothetical protein